MSTTSSEARQRPYFIAGAGELVIHVYREADGEPESNYLFNFFRTNQSGATTQFLRPNDLCDLVKACQVLAFAIADDGWIDESQHRQLVDLREELDEITQRWSN